MSAGDFLPRIFGISERNQLKKIYGTVESFNPVEYHNI